MPRIYYRLRDKAEITVWKANEETSFYSLFLKENNFPTATALRIKNPEKRRQWYISRYVMLQVYPEAIQYYSHQKPMLMNGPRISLSHSKNDVAIMLSEQEGGIDIQWPEEKLLKIASKYINDSDLAAMSNLSELSAHTLIWSVKEAVFKYFGTGVTFKEIKIRNYNPVYNTADVEIKRQNEFHKKQLCADFIDEMAIAYLIE